jgi:GNAT superfamily N-acetyltransferase
LSFLASKCTFSVLDEVVLKSSSLFDCGHPDLNDFFSNDCIAYSKELLGKSYCFRLDSDLSVIACAFTVSNDSIKVNSLPNSRKKKLVKSIPRPKQFRSYPAVLIGRLGVNQNYKGVGIGRELMNFIKSWFIDSNNKTGCRFIVVDAYNEKTPIKYYKQNDFEFLFSTEEQEKEYMGLLDDDQLKTRLMYFDLIVLSS